MSFNLLLTGGRAPATLDLARLFSQAGHRVFVADSMGHQLCSLSRHVSKNFLVPPPRWNYPGYIQSLIEIIQAAQIDLLIPTCEEIFYIAHGLDELRKYCRVFAEPLDKLNRLHNKWEFIQLAQRKGLRVPQTWLLQGKSNFLEVVNSLHKKIILKPVYSRFASNIHVMRLPFDNLPDINVNPTFPWVAQEFIRGQHYSSYTIAHQGKITAHAIYPRVFTAGTGSCIYFQSVRHPEIDKWVNDFLLGEDFTGQIAFDWIENQRGEIYAIECNPRTISAIHLFTPEDRLERAFFPEINDSQGKIIQPQPQQTAMISMAMLLYGLPAAISSKTKIKWLQIFLKTPDVIFKWDDPLPFFSTWIVLMNALWASLKTKKTLMQVSTQDIEWDGEPITIGETMQI